MPVETTTCTPRIRIFEVQGDQLGALIQLFRGPVFEAFSRHPGFLGYQSFVDRERGRLVGMSPWASLRDLEASSESARQARAQAAALGAATVGEPQILELAYDARADLPARP